MRFLRSLPIVAALGILMVACFHRAFLGEQFDYRDAAHFYYPLYQRVQMEWDAGRWPLWEAEENSGMPLLGNPTAAVLYPGKIIYAVLPYPLAARTYVIVHVLISFAGAVLLARNFGIGWVGSSIAGLSYAFGAPILFQYCNIIFLVGGAWTPFALASADRWLRGGKRLAIVELGVFLALQVLGGDPQSAYMVGLCAGGYALALSRARSREGSERPGNRLVVGLLVLLGLAAWIGSTLLAAAVLPGLRPPSSRPPTPTFLWAPWVSKVAIACWSLVGVVLLRRWQRRRPLESRLMPCLIGLAIAAGLAGLLCAAQLLPVMEFTRLTGRAADEGPHDIYPFSLAPFRLLEFVFPNVFGTTNNGNHSWIGLMPPRVSHRIWVPSLYLGGIPFLLALSVAGFRRVPTWRGWITAIVLVSVLASLGEFGGPLFWARRVPGMESVIGPPDDVNTNAIRQDRQLRDGDGSIYWFMSVVLPGFHSFRYPSKLLAFTVLGLSILSGVGWDRLMEGERRRLARLGLVQGLLGIGAVVALVACSGPLFAFFRSYDSKTAFGPFSPEGAYRDLWWSASQVLAVATAVAVLMALSRRSPRLADALVLFLVALDLSVANAHSVLTSPQEEFDQPPKYLSYIQEAEKQNPAPGPYRIHRMPVWSPPSWFLKSSPDRVRDFLVWEKDTLQPKYGITHGVEYTFTQGTAELFDYEWFFGPFDQPVTPQLASQIGKISTKERIIYYPRRGFDMWNTRYFVLPGYTIWTDTERGVASLIQDTEPIYPLPKTFEGPGGEKRYEDWIKNEDVQIVRNRNFMPRAWVVHRAWFRPPIAGLSRRERAQPMEEMTFANDAIWHDPGRVLHDPRQEAWVEDNDIRDIQSALVNAKEHTDDFVRVVKHEPQRVELEARLVDNGIVVLSDIYYPGWTLTVDGAPAKILRTNRLMRGVLIEGSPKTRKLVYTYEPQSFRWGLRISVVGLCTLLGLGLWGWKADRAAARMAPTDLR